MEANTFRVNVTTPQQKWTFEKVVSCTAPGVNGNFQVLLNHAPLFSQLEVGEIKISTDEEVELYATSGGFLEVLNNNVALLLETCESASEIDLERAEASAERARQRLRERAEHFDITRAEVSLARAINRIRVASKIKMTVQ